VTDACLVLGYLDAEYFLGGAMKLDRDAAQAALAELGATLGLGPDEAAHAVLRLATENMVQAIEGITINQGVDPSSAVLVGGGGAAGLNAALIGRRLGCPQVVIPEAGSVLSAMGMLLSDLVAEYAATFVTDSRSFDADGVNNVLSHLEKKALEFVEKAGGLEGDFSLTFSADARYPDQIWELPVQLTKSRFVDDADVRQLCQSFHDLHQQVFAVNDPHSDIAVVGWRVRVEYKLHSSDVALPRAAGLAARHHDSREVWFPEVGRMMTPVFELSQLPEGRATAGPALLVSPLTTIVVDPNTVALRSTGSNVILTQSA
jgi:N-methylhydantoinase A